MRVENRRNQQVIGDRIVHANTFFRRLRGLLGCRNLMSGSGVLLDPCQGVHGFGMSIVCDVIYLDQQDRVVATCKLQPWHHGPFVRQARRVLEVPVGTIKRSDTSVGDQLTITP